LSHYRVDIKSTGKGRNQAREASEISFHSLRHSAVTMLKAAGVSDFIARGNCGARERRSLSPVHAPYNARQARRHAAVAGRDERLILYGDNQVGIRGTD
jgi:hypothetical protein